MGKTPIYEAVVELSDGQILRYLTLEPQYHYVKNPSFVNPSHTHDAIPHQPIGYLAQSPGELSNE